jgi:hypothetical protein
MRIERKWAMPNASTFSIKPIREWIEKHMLVAVVVDAIADLSQSGPEWADPFVGKSPFKVRMRYTNDLNPEIEATHHLDALKFLEGLETASLDGVIYDPPYSPRQVSEMYKGFGMKVTSVMTRASFWSDHKRQIGRIVKPGGVVLSFGWNSGGMGMSQGFDIESILLVPHGGYHHDTICVQERKR